MPVTKNDFEEHRNFLKKIQEVDIFWRKVIVHRLIGITFKIYPSPHQMDMKMALDIPCYQVDISH